MELSIQDLRRELRALAHPERALGVARFFKTGKGEYGAGDKFLGINVPALRKIARKFRELPLADAESLLLSRWHEERLCALIILVAQFERGTETERQAIFNFYLAHTDRVNNWDLVDASAPYIVGGWLVGRTRDALDRLALSESMWERRIAMVATLWFIRRGELADTFRIAKTLLDDQEPLLHKAIGWMLREAGKKDEPELIAFLREHYAELPRTTLRYAIERFPAERRKRMLQGDFGRSAGARTPSQLPGSIQKEFSD
jgi:3-methyladenine DNA glycosylase AlkD